MRSRTKRETILFGRWSQQDLDRMLAVASGIPGAGGRIEFISKQFMGVPYKESTLVGDTETPEVFTINLEAVDCFTYLDYVEAMRMSDTFFRFKENLKKIRYRSGKVAYAHRNHFFTDWREQGLSVTDVTAHIGSGRERVVMKRLNEKADGTYFIPGIAITERDVTHIPAEVIDHAVIASLQTGDYIGIYTEAEGLDVSHVGIIIKGKDATYLRHASSAHPQRKVIDENFKAYTAGKPGIVVLRPTA